MVMKQNEARTLARDYAEANSPHSEMSLHVELIEEWRYGWFFSWGFKNEETGVIDCLIGGSPIFVDKEMGTPEPIGSAYSIKRFKQEYREQLILSRIKRLFLRLRFWK